MNASKKFRVAIIFGVTVVGRAFTKNDNIQKFA
jgi:hypothetical protein